MKFNRRQAGITSILFIACLIILSWTGLTKLYPESNTLRYIPDRIYKIIKIAFGSDPSGTAIEPKNTPWQLIVAKIFTICILLVGAYKIIQKIFEEQIALLLAAFKRNHYISVGAAKKGRQILHSLKNEVGKKAVVIEKNPGNANISTIKKEGHTVITGNAEEKEILLEAGVKRASFLILFLENEQTVIEIVETVQRIYKKSATDHLLKCYLHLRHPRLIELVKNAGLRSQNHHIEMHFFNQHKMIARQFFPHVLADLKLQHINLQDIQQIILLGYENFSKAILLQALRVCHISVNNPLNIAVYSKNAERDRQIFTELYPKAHNIFSVTFHEFNGSFSVLKTNQQLQELDKHTLFITVFDDDEDNLNYSLEVLNATFNLSFPIYTLNTEGTGLRSLMNHTTELSRLKFFGNMEEVGTIEFITEEKQDTLARAIHDDYQRKLSGADSESSRYTSDWHTLSEEAKDANRAQADHIPFKLRLVNKSPTDFWSSPEVSFSEDETEMLAIIEHSRWMAHRYLNGWDYGATRNDEMKLHPSLVPWEHLSESEKQKDRETVLRIGWLLKL